MTKPGRTSPGSGGRPVYSYGVTISIIFRRENFWESPKTAVSGEMVRLGFTDCWAAVGRPGLVETCRSYTSYLLPLTCLCLIGSPPTSTMCTPTRPCWLAGNALRFSMWRARPAITAQCWPDLPRNNFLEEFGGYFYCKEMIKII